MTKKSIITLIILMSFVGGPTITFAEKLYMNPKPITLETAPHSAKPKSKKSTSKVLKLGARSYDVTVLQNFLIKKAAGPAAVALAKNKASGYFGPLTKEALIEFQKANGLTPDGIAGAKVKAMYKK